MKRKIIGFLILTAGLLGIIAILYYLFIKGLFPDWMNFWKKESINPVTNVQKRAVQEKKNVIDDGNQPKKVINFEINEEEIERKENVEKEFGKDDLMRIASSFAERFGSYSNQSDFSNVEDLKIYMTDRMKSWAEGYVLEHRSVVSDSENYFGITSKAVDSQVIEFDENAGTAKISVVCRRREAKNEMANSQEVYSQNVVIIMKKEYETWKVDNAFWEGRQ